MSQHNVSLAAEQVDGLIAALKRDDPTTAEFWTAVDRTGVSREHALNEIALRIVWRFSTGAESWEDGDFLINRLMGLCLRPEYPDDLPPLALSIYRAYDLGEVDGEDRTKRELRAIGLA
jgi:hypothetical protein